MPEHPEIHAAAGAVAPLRTARLVLPCDLKELKSWERFLTGFAQANALPEEARRAVDLALTEWLTNVISYGFGDGKTEPILVNLELVGNELRVEVEDGGKPFNPLDFPMVDTRIPLERRPVGGLGIHLMRQSLDHMEYERAHDKNRLRMSKRLARP